MSHDLSALLARNTNTVPVLLSQSHAEEVVQRILQADPTALRSPGRVSAFLRRARQALPGDDGYVRGTHEHPQHPEAYAPIWLGEPDEALDYGMALKDGVATISVNDAIPAKGYWYCGNYIHGYDTIEAAIKLALDDARVNAIFLHLDSPGGVVHDGINTLSETIRMADKTIWAYADMACSAAYWIASQCEWIVAPSTGLIGSIGACIIHTEGSEWLKREGIRVTPIESGENKTDGASFKPLSDAAQEHLQSFVDQAASAFITAVNIGRPELEIETIVDMQARWYAAEHDDPSVSGLALNLCDQILSEQAAFAALVDQSSGAVGAPGNEA